MVISPGSRSAALTLAFARHPDIKTKVVIDERVAGFVALGMAQQSEQAVALVCTSGSAAYNLAPAVVEAFFQEIPLLVFTADRPPEWTGQQDGQTMYQSDLYGKHVKKSFSLPADYQHPDSVWYIERVVNEAIHLSQENPKGPVHINVPIREPFYPTSEERFEYNKNVRLIDRISAEKTLSTQTWHRLQMEWENADKILIAAGQLTPNEPLWKTLKQLSDEMGVVVLGDCTSNIPYDESFVRNHDVFLSNKDESFLETLRPDLLVTIGNSFLSKNLKQFLRKNPPKRHWQIKENSDLVDSLQSLTKQIPVSPAYFFEKLLADLDYQQFVQNEEDNEGRLAYKDTWQRNSLKTARSLNMFLNQEQRWSEFVIVRDMIEQMPIDSILHLANSMPVRYVNLIGTPVGVEVRSNRGVSGIDGCTSTAVGAASMTNKLVFLLTGDVAFFYDRNALWNKDLPSNLRIILLNNNGGNIFRLIDGPASQPELEQYFETPHQLNAENTCKDCGIFYHQVKSELLDNKSSFLVSSIPKDFFCEGNTCQLVEIFTDSQLNAQVFADYKKYFS